MQKFTLFLIIALVAFCNIELQCNNPAFCDVVSGGVEKQGLGGTNKVIDAQTSSPISGARITMPQQNFKTYTDQNGQFDFGPKIDGQTVMSVEKDGYRPFSMTVDDKITSHPIILGIEKSTPHDLTIDTNMFHLGDNNFSDLSANSKDFQVKAIGPFYSKTFKIPAVAPNSKTSLIIGSIIGVDTMLAKSMGQNKITTAFASPPEVYFNGNQIAEIQVNGDGQKIRIPNNLIRPNQLNEVTIKTGRNLMQTAYVDYDDIEFMNLSIETK